MKHIIYFAILGLCGVLAATHVSGSIVFQDDFESYTVGTYPNAGGWIMTYNGTGTGNQYVENLYAHSGSQSLRLQGQQGWSSASDVYVSIPEQAILRTSFYVHEIPQGTSDTHVGIIGMENRDLGSWGTQFAGILLDAAGNVQAYPGLFSIGTYTAQTWHNLIVTGDFATNTYSIMLDGQEILTDQSTGQSTIPTDVRLLAGFGSSPNALIRFDDVVVEDRCAHDGDVNGNGSITADDAQLTFLITLGLYPPTLEEECSADCDGNGTVTAADAQTIFLSVLGLGSCVN